jgi:hypothetical protein
MRSAHDGRDGLAGESVGDLVGLLDFLLRRAPSGHKAPCNRSKMRQSAAARGGLLHLRIQYVCSRAFGHAADSIAAANKKRCDCTRAIANARKSMLNALEGWLQLEKITSCPRFRNNLQTWQHLIPERHPAMNVQVKLLHLLFTEHLNCLEE